MAAPESNLPPLPPISSATGSPGILLQHGLLSAPLQPGQLASLDHYQILGELGQGGMGIVLRGRDSGSGEIVAIKMLRPELAAQPQQVHRFLKEARHMQRLKHPHVLPVLHVSEDPASPCFVMPLLERGSLLQQLSEEQLMTEEECLAVARQVASALAHAHAKGVMHRDLKPGNVLLDASGTAFLADFGLARTVFNDSLVDAARGETGEGTAPYMSPQLARGEAEDTRCDIYALGALCYEMLTGRPPYEGQSTAQILQQIRTGPPVSILKLRPRLAPALVKVIECAMAREHRDRYANMPDVLADLERLAVGQMPLGSKAALCVPYVVSGRSRQLGAVLVLFVAVGFAGFGYSWLRSGFSLELLQEVSIPGVNGWANTQTGDWDGDGKTDLIHLNEDKLYVITGHDQQLQPQPLAKSNAGRLSLDMMADLNGDKMDEALVSSSSGSNAYLTAFNQRAWPIREFVFSGSVSVHDEWGTNRTRLQPLRQGDLDGDGKLELLVAATSSWSLRPRGICCFDAETAQLKWFFETANFVAAIDLRDLDNDGRMEVIVGGNAPGNGCRLEDDTDDGHTYLYVLSFNGELKWRRELGGVFARVGLLSGAPTNRTILAWVTSSHAYDMRRAKPDTGMILEFDAEGNLRHQCDLGVELTGALNVDLDGDGKCEVLAGDRLGVLHQLDDSLQERRRVTIAPPRYDEVQLQLFPVGSLVSSGATQLALTSCQIERRTDPAPGNSRRTFETIFYHDNRITILDANLKPLASHLLAETWTEYPGLKVSLPRHAGKSLPKLIVLTDRVQYFALVQTNRPLFSRSKLSSQLQ
jgi:hypothetical protein